MDLKENVDYENDNYHTVIFRMAPLDVYIEASSFDLSDAEDEASIGFQTLCDVTVYACGPK